MLLSPKRPRPSAALRLSVISAVDIAQGDSIQSRIRDLANRNFKDEFNGHEYRFTPRTISTWLYRFKSQGVTTIENKTRSDKGQSRKIKIEELAEMIKEVMPMLNLNKQGRALKSSIYRLLLNKGLVDRRQLAQTTFYRMVRAHNLIDAEASKKLRLSFAMKHANELWQADTMYGPSIKQPDGKWRKTFLIAFIDDASRVITHAEFFYNDNTENMVDAFRTALYKRGRPERLYFDNGSNYRSKEIAQACLRMGIKLIHAPVRDGAAKGKIERFFRGFRDRFLTTLPQPQSIAEINTETSKWIEEEYNRKHHSAILMAPVDRFALDTKRIQYLNDDEYSEEIFFVEEDRKVGKTNLFSINNQKFECPIDLRDKCVQVRYDRKRRTRFVVYFNEKRMGEALSLDLQHNSQRPRTIAD